MFGSEVYATIIAQRWKGSESVSPLGTKSQIAELDRVAFRTTIDDVRIPK